MAQVSKNFIIQEFVPPVVFNQFGDRAIWVVDPRIIGFCQWLRDYTGKAVTINNWHQGGPRSESCFRLPLSTTGASLSQHKFGRAVDAKVDGLTPDEVRGIIRKNYDLLLVNYGITTIEKDTPSWAHADCRATGLKTLLEVPYA